MIHFGKNDVSLWYGLQTSSMLSKSRWF